MEHSLLDFNQYPVWFNYIFSLFVIIASGAIGYKCSTVWKTKESSSNQNGLLVGSMLGLLSFILAFTFSISATRFDNRKAALLDQINAIDTANLRADFLQEPLKSEVKGLLYEYVCLLAELAEDEYSVDEINAKSDAIQAKLWEKVTAGKDTTSPPALIPFVANSLNTVFDVHTHRYIIGEKYRIQPTIWGFFYFMISFSIIGVGYSTGLSKGISPFLALILTLTFAAVIYLIADLDNGDEGFLKINQQPMVQLKHDLKNKLNK